MSRFFVLVYGVFAYITFAGVLLYLAGFLANVAVPSSIDSEQKVPIGIALVVDFMLIALFGLQHSVMARPTFKAWLKKLIPESIERSTYVMATNFVLILLFWQWRPIELSVWEFTTPIWYSLFMGLFAAGWLTVLVTTFLINHFDLFGLRQVWLAFRKHSYTPLPFVTPGPYQFIRHPLYVGWMIVFWATPSMTVGHLLFAVGMTTYMLIAIPFEERDLMKSYGASYEKYRANTPMFLPGHDVLSTTNRQPSS